MLSSREKIIVTSIKNIEEMYKNKEKQIPKELKKKMDDVIYKGYEALSDMIGQEKNVKIKKTQNKEPDSYKSLYIKDKLVKQIEKIDTENNTSFNNVIISMIEQCLKEK